MPIAFDISKPLTGIKVQSERVFSIGSAHTGVLSLRLSVYDDLSCLPVIISLAQLKAQQKSNGTPAQRVAFRSYHAAPHLHAFVCHACTCCDREKIYEQTHEHHRQLIHWQNKKSTNAFYIDSIEGQPLPTGIDESRLRQSILSGLAAGYADLSNHRKEPSRKAIIRQELPAKVIMLIRSDLVDQNGFDRITREVQRHLTP